MAERNAVSMQDLTDELGISKATVSKALNGKEGVGEELREKIFQTAKSCWYVLPDYGKRKYFFPGLLVGAVKGQAALCERIFSGRQVGSDKI